MAIATPMAQLEHWLEVATWPLREKIQLTKCVTGSTSFILQLLFVLEHKNDYFWEEIFVNLQKFRNFEYFEIFKKQISSTRANSMLRVEEFVQVDHRKIGLFCKTDTWN